MLELKDEYQKTQLTIFEVEKEVIWGSVKIKIQISNRNFNATFDSIIEGVWLSFTEIESFIQVLEILEKSRDGETTLTALDTNEFHLKIFNIDKLGHLAAQVEIEKGISPFKTKILSTFEIDPSSIPKIIFELQKFIKSNSL